MVKYQHELSSLLGIAIHTCAILLTATRSTGSNPRNSSGNMPTCAPPWENLGYQLVLLMAISFYVTWFMMTSEVNQTELALIKQTVWGCPRHIITYIERSTYYPRQFMCSALTFLTSHYHVNSLRPRQNRRHFADDIFKCIFLNENV